MTKRNLSQEQTEPLDQERPIQGVPTQDSAQEPAQPILVDPLEGWPFDGDASSPKSETEPTSPRHESDLDDTIAATPASATVQASADDEKQAMASPSVRLDTLITYLLIGLPVGCVALLLVALGWLTLPGFLLVSAASLLGAYLLLRRHRTQIAALSTYLWRHAADPDETITVPPAPPGSLISGTLVASLFDALRSGQQARIALISSDAGKEALLAALPYPLVTVTAERRVTRANRAAKALFDSPVEGLDLISVLREPALLSAAESVLAGEESQTLEFTIAGGLMQHFVAQIRRLPFALPDGTIAILVLQDVTALKRAEQLRADFVANASHELKTPLASLMGFIETLDGAARDDPEARARFLPIMAEQSVRMAHLIEDLLSLSRIEMHEHTPPREVVDLTALLKRVAAALSIEAEKRQIALVVQAEAGLAAYGDEDELEQVFRNLVENAIKYGRANSSVTIEAEAPGPTDMPSRPGRTSVTASVIDQGGGIPREHLPRLTERFYRVDKARSRALGGTGLGLAIVKHIVNRHRGRLEIKSEPGQGSVFTVHLRAAVLPPDELSTQESSVQEAAPSSRRALAT